MRKLRFFALIFFIITLSACGGNYKVDDPVKGAIFSTAPTVFSFSYREAPEELPSVILNGQDVRELFIQGEDQATADGNDILPYLVEGNNRFQVDPPLGPKSNFIYDTKGPEVVIVNASDNTLSGFTIDSVDTRALFLNELPIDLNEDGSFETNFATTDILSFAAEDELGHLSSIQFRDGTLSVDDAIRARVNQSGLNFVASEAVQILNGLNFNALVAGTEVYSDVRNGPLGTKRGREGHITNLGLSVESLSIDPTANGLRLRGKLTSIVVRFRLVSYLGILPDIVLKPIAVALSADLDGLVEMNAENGKPNLSIKDLKLDLGLLRFTGALGVFDAILNNLISNTVRILDRRISGALADPISRAINNALGDLIPSSYAFDVNGVALNARFDLNELGTTDDAINIAVTGGLEALNPSNLIPDQFGPRYQLDDISSHLPNVGDLGVAINTNVINQSLMSAFKSGITHLTIQNGNVQLNLPRNDGLGNNGDTRILIDPVTAPFINVSSADNNANLELNIIGLQIQSQTKASEGWQSNFSVQLSANVNLGVAIAADNSLDVSIDSNPSINFHKITLGQGNSIDEVFVEGVVADILPSVLNTFSDVLKGIRIPALAGYVITLESIDTLGDNNSYLGLSGTLSEAP